MPPSMTTRNTSASESPMRRAISRRSAGSRDTRSEMKTTLSMPSTISIALKAMKLAHASGLVSQSSMRLAVGSGGGRGGVLNAAFSWEYGWLVKSGCGGSGKRAEEAEGREIQRRGNEQDLHPERRWKGIGHGGAGGSSP